MIHTDVHDVEHELPKSQLRLEVFVSPAAAIGDTGLTFSPTTSSLIYGDHDVVLVDAQYLRRDVIRLGNMIEALDRTLTTIFITHGHADHYFGAGMLAQRFPDVRVVATPDVVADIAARGDEQEKAFTAWFGDELALPTTLPDPLGELAIMIEGHRLEVIAVDQADIAPTAALHIPPLNAVIAGDLAYNGIHQFLAESGPSEWTRWGRSIDVIADLGPRTVVAGHKKPEASDHDGPAILAGTRNYLRDFARLAATSASAEALIAGMSELYPEHGNTATLGLSAHTAMKATTDLKVSSSPTGVE